MASAINFLSDEEKNAVVSAIRNVELYTSGEIRVHIDNRCDGDPYDRAVNVFYHLNMDKTLFRNGVLIYIATQDRKFSIIGDEAIQGKIDKNFWSTIIAQLIKDFKNNSYKDGIVTSIDTIGNVLKKYFPAIDNLNSNSIPDDISYE